MQPFQIYPNNSGTAFIIEYVTCYNPVEFKNFTTYNVNAVNRYLDNLKEPYTNRIKEATEIKHGYSLEEALTALYNEFKTIHNL